MLDEKNNITDSLPSPLSNISKTRKLGGRIAIILIGFVLLYLIFSSHYSKPKVSEKIETQEPTANLSAPELAAKPVEIDKLKMALEETQDKTVAVEAEEAEKLQKMRMLASTTVYSVSSNTSEKATNTNNGNNNAILGGNGQGDVNTDFIGRLSSSKSPTESATHILHPDSTLVQGTMIWATLETRIISDLPGMVRAVTSEDIYSEDSSTVLLPRGSHLIGQYTNAISQGQNRVFVVWQRVIRPDHIDIQLNSPGTDALGSSGIGADSIDHHFIEQFGTATLLSLISAGVSNIGVGPQDQFNSASTYREALSSSFNQTATTTLQNTGAIKPTITKDQGSIISVFVARDLDFYDQLHGNA